MYVQIICDIIISPLRHVSLSFLSGKNIIIIIVEQQRLCTELCYLLNAFQTRTMYL